MLDNSPAYNASYIENDYIDNINKSKNLNLSDNVIPTNHVSQIKRFQTN